MKKLFLILLISIPTLLCAQIIVPNAPLTDRELLLEVIKQQNKISEQLIATNVEIKGISTEQKGTQKQIDMLFYMMIAMLSGIFGLIAFVVWDRQASIKPILQENKDLAKEIAQLKERELKFEEKTENHFKKIAQIDARFAGIL